MYRHLFTLSGLALGLLASCSSSGDQPAADSPAARHEAKKDSAAVLPKVKTPLTGLWRGVAYAEDEKGWVKDSMFVQFMPDGQMELGIPGKMILSSGQKHITRYEYDSTRKPPWLDMIIHPRTPEAARDFEQQTGVKGDLRMPGIVKFISPDEVLWANDLNGAVEDPQRPVNFKDSLTLRHLWRMK